ncbi:NAD(P)/FAD-dependent oxidoreductase [Mariniluteicoccus flavus]
MTATHTHDVVIIGGGAAGLTAGILLARARRGVVVVDSGEPRNSPAAHARGFLSRDGVPPQELLRLGREEFLGFGGEVVDDRVVALDADRTVRTEGGVRLCGRRVLLATGLRDRLPDLPGVAERWGRDVLHCPYCHGYEVRDQRLVVLGTHPMAAHQALLLPQWSPRVTLLSHELDLTDEQRDQLRRRGVEVVPGGIRELAVADDRLRGVVVEGREVPCDAAFLFPPPEARDGFLAGIEPERDQFGLVVTDDQQRTTVPWLFAAGNSTNARAQVITAAGEGSTAGIAINMDLVLDDLAVS